MIFIDRFNRATKIKIRNIIDLYDDRKSIIHNSRQISKELHQCQDTPAKAKDKLPI